MGEVNQEEWNSMVESGYIQFDTLKICEVCEQREGIKREDHDLGCWYCCDICFEGVEAKYGYCRC